MSRERARRGLIPLFALGAATAALGVGVAVAAEAITAAPVCCSFASPQYTMAPGESPRLTVPADADASHDVAAKRKGPDGRPLFFSNSAKPGESVAVGGARYLAAGSYPFLCPIHGSEMSAALVVSGPGSPLSRPKIEVTIPRQPLDRVRRSGKLAVAVEASAASAGVALVAKRGRKTLASKAGLKLPRGIAKTVKLKLTAAGKRALEDVRSSAVSVKGTVPFGAPDTGRRTLR